VITIKPTLITYDGLYELLEYGKLYNKYGKHLVAYTDLSSESSGAMPEKIFEGSYTLLEGQFEDNKQVYLLR